jgi:hypothetical protein
MIPVPLLEPATSIHYLFQNHLSGAVHAIEKRLIPVHSFALFEIVSIRNRSSSSRNDSNGNDSADGG